MQPRGRGYDHHRGGGGGDRRGRGAGGPGGTPSHRGAGGGHEGQGGGPSYRGSRGGRGDRGQSGGGGGQSYRGSGGGRGHEGQGGGASYRGSGGGRGDRGRGDGGGGSGRGRGRGRGGRPVDIYNPGGPTPNRDTQSMAAEDALVQKFKVMNMQELEQLPLRPGYGTKGDAVVLRTNYFPLDKWPQGPLYEYKIYYQPEAKAKRVRGRLLQILDESPDFNDYKRYVAHDGSEKLISTRRLYIHNENPLEIRVPFSDDDASYYQDEESEIYTLTFSFTGELSKGGIDNHLKGVERQNTSPFISALEILLAKFASKKGLRIRRNCYFFPTIGAPMDLGGGLEVFRGFYSSVRPTLNSLMINVNVCYTAFYKIGKLSDALDAFERASFGADPSKFVERLRVVATHLSYRPKKTICGLAGSADACSFYCELDSVPKLKGTITVKEYFKRKYNMDLRSPKWVINVGKPNDPRYLPAELVEILPNQPFKEKLLDSHTASMIIIACKNPADNARLIVGEGLCKLGFNDPKGRQDLETLGIRVGSELAVLSGRVLPPPVLEYGEDKSPNIAREKASWNLDGVKFYRGQPLKNWGVFVINPSLSGNDLKDLIEKFKRTLASSGIAADDVDTKNIFSAKLDPDTRSMHSTLRERLKTLEKRLSFVLVILSNQEKRIYAAIRRMCDVELGIPATCVQGPKFRRGDVVYFANVSLKINAKLGGVNHTLRPTSATWLKQESTMLVGMDVTHPGLGSIKGTPSIAGVVASYDKDFALYPASLRLQKTKQEMIDGLDDMMTERLKLFRSKRQELPKRIIVFRDGVSEGQFLTVLRHELPQIRGAFKRMDISYNPKLSIIICGKRHHTRFYPTDTNSADGCGNPKPGTVVDRRVVPVYDFDFFLQAHSGIQGTTRPTHYTVVHDENNFGPDDIQGLVNNASYMYARATRAVSLVPPAYYADLACERGRLYIQEFLTPSEGNSFGKLKEEDVFRQAEKKWGKGIHPNVASTMFYI